MIGVSERGAVVADEELLARGRLLEDHLAHVELGRLGRGVFLGDDGGGDGGVRIPDLLEDVLLAHVAGDHDRGVVGRVVRLVEGDAVLGVEALDVHHPADGRPVIGVLGEGGLVEDLVRGALDVVVDAHAALVGDDLLLAHDLRLAQHELRHAIALELHGEAEAILGQRLVVVGPVEPRAGVRLGAVLLELAIELSRLEAFALVEHEVLEEVREAGLPGLLVA